MPAIVFRLKAEATPSVAPLGLLDVKRFGRQTNALISSLQTGRRICRTTLTTGWSFPTMS
jgi:hypothetical protein